jgi:hypothetical protein
MPANPHVTGRDSQFSSGKTLGQGKGGAPSVASRGSGVVSQPVYSGTKDKHYNGAPKPLGSVKN